MSDGVGAVDPWEAEARKKKLPEEWIETMANSDGFTEAQKEVFVAHLDSPSDFAAKRKRAVEIGRRYGTDEADSRRETGADRQQRIKRAMAYAAWEFDGKPLSSEAQRIEFGVEKPKVAGFMEREQAWRKRGEQA